MASATASKAIRGQIQNIHTFTHLIMDLLDLIPVFLDYSSEIKFFLFKDIFLIDICTLPNVIRLFEEKTSHFF